MVKQTINYYRFDTKEWINPETGAVEQYNEFIARYDISEPTTYFAYTTDIDNQPDTMTIRVNKTFFNNPTYNDAYSDGGTDQANTFSPKTNHIIILGNLSDVKDSDSYESDMIIGVITNCSDYNTSKVELTCQSFLKNLTEKQSETDYHFNRDTSTISDTTHVSDDEPNRLQLYYDEAAFKLESEQPSDYWSRSIDSSPGFPAMNAGSNENYPYAIYMLSGIAAGNGTITINALDATNPNTTISSTKSFVSGDTAEFIISKFGNLSLGTDSIRVSTYNDGVVFQSLDFEKNYVVNIPSTTQPIVLSGSVGTLQSHYIYVGKSGEAGKPPEDGRNKITPLSERAHAPSDLPFHAMNIYSFDKITVDDVENTYLNVFPGYSLSKIAWRIMQDIGWCRYPYFEDMNPFIVDYDSNGNTNYYTSYDTDGLYMDFDEIDYGDGITRRKMQFLSSFNPSKQSLGYNLKTISDDQGMFLNTNISPKIINYIPEWDENVYHQPSFLLMDLYGFSEYEVGITVKFPTIIDGTVSQETVYCNSEAGMTTKEMMAVLETALKEIPEIEDYYTILRRGSRLYMETRNLDIAAAMRATPGTYYYQASVSQVLPTTIKIVSESNIERTSDAERLAEKVYYLRRWGIFPGFHPKVSIRLPSNMRLQSPDTELTLYYGGENTRTSSGDAPSIVETPTWSLYTNDMINKVIVTYSADDTTSDEQTYITFPSTTKNYNYYSIHLDGVVTGSEVEATLSLTIDLGTSIATGTLVSYLQTDYTAAEVANTFNERVFNIAGYEFPVAASGKSIFILSNSTTTSYLHDTSQTSFVLNTSDKIINDTKELVREEPALFDEARDSQAKNGIKEYSLTLPEVVSINDTIAFVGNIFKKYMNPKDRCICNITETDGWHIPLFTYTHIIDYTNFDTGTETADWYVDVLFTKPATVNQNVNVTISYTDGSSSISQVPVLAGDTASDMARKMYESTDGDLIYFNKVLYDNKIELLSTVNITRTISIISIFGDGEDLNISSRVLQSANFQKSMYKNKKLVLLRVEGNSSSSTYTATFGQPVEATNNIINQVNSWVGDVEKSSTNLRDALDPDYSSLVISNWVSIGSTGTTVLLDGSVGKIWGNEIETDRCIIDNYASFPGNEICRLSGSGGYLSHAASAATNIIAHKILYYGGIYYAIYATSTGVYSYYYTPGGSWTTGWYKTGTLIDSVDVSISGGRFYVIFGDSTPNTKIYVACLIPSTCSLDTSFGASGYLSYSLGLAAFLPRITVSGAYIHITYVFYLSGYYYIYYNCYTVASAIRTMNQLILYAQPSAIPAFDIHTCGSTIYLAVSYVDTTTNNSVVTVYQKPNTGVANFTTDGNYDALISRDIYNLTLSSIESTHIVLWGTARDYKSYLSVAPNSTSLSWTRNNLADLGISSGTGGIAYDSSGSTGFVIARTAADSTILKVYKITSIQNSLISTNISTLYSKSISYSFKPDIFAVDTNSAMGAYLYNSSDVLTGKDIYLTFSTDNTSISTNVVILQITDSKDYYYDTSVPTNGYIVLPTSGIYSISWQLYRSATSASAYLKCNSTEISGDTGTGYLKGSHSGIHLTGGDVISLVVSGGTKSDWNELGKAYIEIHLVSKDA